VKLSVCVALLVPLTMLTLVAIWSAAVRQHTVVVEVDFQAFR